MLLLELLIEDLIVQFGESLLLLWVDAYDRLFAAHLLMELHLLLLLVKHFVYVAVLRHT